MMFAMEPLLLCPGSGEDLLCIILAYVPDSHTSPSAAVSPYHGPWCHQWRHLYSLPYHKVFANQPPALPINFSSIVSRVQARGLRRLVFPKASGPLLPRCQAILW